MFRANFDYIYCVVSVCLIVLQYGVVIPVTLYSYEETHSDAHCEVPLLVQGPQVALTGYEGICFCEPILSTSGVCRVHQRHHEVSSGNAN